MKNYQTYLDEMLDWPYYDWNEDDGFLYDEDGDKTDIGPFKTSQEAEQYLEDNDIRGNIREGFFKTGLKLLPVFAMLFHLLVSDVQSKDNIPSEDIKIALIDMQISKNKDELDANSQKVMRLVSSLKGPQRNKFVEIFNKAYHETENKIGS